MIDQASLAVIKKFVHDNAPTLLSSLGVVGTVSTAYLAGRASYTAAMVVYNEEVDEHGVYEPITPKEKVGLVWKLYIPAGVSGVVTVGSIVTASKISANRSAAIAAAYSISEKAFQEYKLKVVEQMGPRKEQKVRDEIAQDRVTNSPPHHSLVISDGTQILCCELYTGRYFLSTIEALKKAQNEVNAIVVNELYATMNDFYDNVGLEYTSMSGHIGWNSDKLMELEFTTTLSTDDRPCIAFTYSHVETL